MGCLGIIKSIGNPCVSHGIEANFFLRKDINLSNIEVIFLCVRHNISCVRDKYHVDIVVLTGVKIPHNKGGHFPFRKLSS